MNDVAKNSRRRAVIFWIATGIIGAEFAVGGVMDLLQAAPFFPILLHVGYPGYFSIILGAWKIPGAVTVLVPGFPRLKEWAYAGMFFTMTGAAVSHLAVHDSVVMLIAPLSFGALVIVSWTLRPPSRINLDPSLITATQGRTIIYWIVTTILAVECFVGGVLGALRFRPFLELMNRLGYPPYLMTILGVSYLLAGITILLPRFPRVKDWAYAGLIFTYTGATASRLVAGDGVEGVIGPIIFSGLVFGSWALRPSARYGTEPTMKSREGLHRQLRQRILALPGVTEKPNAGIHEDAFFVAGKMFMHIHGSGHCDIRLSMEDQSRVLAKRKARQHRWAPEKGYVTFKVHGENDLDPAMELIRASHDYFADQQIT